MPKQVPTQQCWQQPRRYASEVRAHGIRGAGWCLRRCDPPPPARGMRAPEAGSTAFIEIPLLRVRVRVRVRAPNARRSTRCRYRLSAAGLGGWVGSGSGLLVVRCCCWGSWGWGCGLLGVGLLVIGVGVGGAGASGVASVPPPEPFGYYPVGLRGGSGVTSAYLRSAALYDTQLVGPSSPPLPSRGRCPVSPSRDFGRKYFGAGAGPGDQNPRSSGAGGARRRSKSTRIDTMGALLRSRPAWRCEFAAHSPTGAASQILRSPAGEWS
jgi:hypothetical protein